MPKKLRVDVVEGHQVSTKRPEVFDVILLIPGDAAPSSRASSEPRSPDVVIMVEPILHAEAGRTLHETAVKRAQHIRRHLGLPDICHQLRIDLVEGAR